MGTFSLIAREPTRDLPFTWIAGVAVDAASQQRRLCCGESWSDPLVDLPRTLTLQFLVAANERSAPGGTRMTAQITAGMTSSVRPGAAST